MTLTGSVQYDEFNDDFNHHNETLQNEALASFAKEGRSLETVLKELYGGQKAFDVGAWMRSRYAEILAKKAAEQEDAYALEVSRRSVNPWLTANAAPKTPSSLGQDMHHTPTVGLEARYQTMQNLWQQASHGTPPEISLMTQQNILANSLNNPLANTLVKYYGPQAAQAMPQPAIPIQSRSWEETLPQARYPQTPVNTTVYSNTPLPKNNAVDWSAYQNASRQNQAAYQAFQQARYNQAREAQQAALQNKLEALEKHQKELLRQQRWKRFEEEQARQQQAIAAKLAAEKRHAEALQQQALLNTRPLDENATLQQMMMGTHPQNIMGGSEPDAPPPPPPSEKAFLNTRQQLLNHLFEGVVFTEDELRTPYQLMNGHVVDNRNIAQMIGVANWIDSPPKVDPIKTRECDHNIMGIFC